MSRKQTAFVPVDGKKATNTAIAIAATNTLETTVNSFVAELTAAQQTAVRENVKAILQAQMVMVQARITVGEALAKLHAALGHESFNSFLEVIGKKLGISKATAYRYYGGYKFVHGQFGQAAANVLAITDGGDKITASDKSKNVVLTREASKVLALMKAEAPLPENPTAEQKEQWARTYVHLLNKETRSVSKGKSPLDICEERITAIWERFGELIERVNKLKGAKERNTALESMQHTVTAMSDEIAKLKKTIASVPAESPKVPAKTKAKKTTPPANVQAA